MTEFSIPQLFESTFGYQLPGRFQVPPPANGSDGGQGDQFQLQQKPARKTVAGLGSPIYQEDTYLGIESFMPLQFTGMKNGFPFKIVPSIAVASIAVKKTIVSTPLVDRVGSVHELISTEDYVISIKGILISPDNSWPEQLIIDLHDMFKANTSVTLRSALTDIFLRGDYNHRVIIRDFKMPANPGVEHAKAFEMECESDGVFTLTI